METFYTLTSVLLLLAILIPIGRRMYPNGSGNVFPEWVSSLPTIVLIASGMVVTAFGFAAIWVSGQVLFGQSEQSVGAWLPVLGILAGLIIALYGLSLLGVVCGKYMPDCD